MLDDKFDKLIPEEELKVVIPEPYKAKPVYKGIWDILIRATKSNPHAAAVSILM